MHRLCFSCHKQVHGSISCMIHQKAYRLQDLPPLSKSNSLWLGIVRQKSPKPALVLGPRPS